MSRQTITDVDIVPFDPRHLEVMAMRDYEQAFLKRIEGSFERIDVLAKRSVEAMTVMLDGRILACCGFLMVLPGVCELWLIPSIYVKDNASSFCKAVLYFIGIIEKNFSVHRLQTTTPDDEFNSRWMEFLGFQCEGVMRQFPTKNENHKIWGRTWQ